MATPGPLSPVARGCARLLLLLWVSRFSTARAVQTLVQGRVQPQGLAIDAGAQKMYWTEVSARSLSRANLDGSSIEVVVPPTRHAEDAPYGVALDTKQGKVYWTTQTTINRANLNGTDVEHLVNITFAVGGIALDVDGGKMYWTSWIDGFIRRANLNGTDQEAILGKGLSMPIDLALDTGCRKVYWADAGWKTVERANMDDGSNREVLNVSWAIMQTNGIALDFQNQRIYLTGSDSVPGGSSGSIYRADLSGSDSEVIIGQNGMDVPYGIALDREAQAVYWTDQKAGTIERLFLTCQPGALQVSSRSNLSDTARLPVDSLPPSVDITVNHGLLHHGSLLSVDCPAGYSGQLRLACNDGVASVSSGQCARNCAAGSITQANGTLIEYDELVDGQTGEAECPGELYGRLHVLCTDGLATFLGGACKVPRDCAAGRQQLPESAMIKHGPMKHGGIEEASCPDGFNGSYTLSCRDGVVEPIGGLCQASCEAGSLWVDGGGGPVEVAHGTIRPNHALKVLCPDGSAGEGVRLECVVDHIRIISSECIRSSRCDAGVKAVNDVALEYPPMSEGDLYKASCPAGYVGEVNFTCANGVVLTQSGMCAANCEAGSIPAVADHREVQIRHGAAEHGGIAMAVCPDGYVGVIPLYCNNGNFSVSCTAADGCACHHIVTKLRESHVAVPLAAIIPLIAALLLCVVAFGVFRRTRVSCHKGVSDTTAACDLIAVESSPPPADASNEVTVESPVPLPPYWATRDGVHIFPDPNRINEVQRLMNETWKVCYTRDRRLLTGDHRVPVGCRVANVLRIENHRGYEKFWHHKVNVAARRGGSLEPFPTLTDRRLNMLDEDCNEKYLFHGTNPEAAHAIARNLFRIDMAGTCRGSMFGPGIYLAENASKSDEYAKEGSGVYVGLCAMLLCRAAAGRVLTAEESSDFSEQVRSGEYDSVCGDRLAAAGTFRELVFFHEQAVYAEFIVIYARIFGDD